MEPATACLKLNVVSAFQKQFGSSRKEPRRLSKIREMIRKVIRDWPESLLFSGRPQKRNPSAFPSCVIFSRFLFAMPTFWTHLEPCQAKTLKSAFQGSALRSWAASLKLPVKSGYVMSINSHAVNFLSTQKKSWEFKLKLTFCRTRICR